MLALACTLAIGPSHAAPRILDYTVQLEIIREGDDGVPCWVHPRAGIVPQRDGPPSVVLTLQQLWLRGSDVFGLLNEMRSDDLGRTWSGPVEHKDTLGHRAEPNDVTAGACDFWPKWHAASDRLLGIGHTVRYRDNAVIRERAREAYFSMYDLAARTWTPWKTLVMPAEARFYNAGAGCVQRVDLPDGDILLQFYFKALGETDYRTAVARVAFDGASLTVREIGRELAHAGGRGLYEPSMAQVGGRFFLTLRNDAAAYVATSRDGLFCSPRRTTAGGPHRWSLRVSPRGGTGSPSLQAMRSASMISWCRSNRHVDGRSGGFPAANLARKAHRGLESRASGCSRAGWTKPATATA